MGIAILGAARILLHLSSAEDFFSPEGGKIAEMGGCIKESKHTKFIQCRDHIVQVIRAGDRPLESQAEKRFRGIADRRIQHTARNRSIAVHVGNQAADCIG